MLSRLPTVGVKLLRAPGSSALPGRPRTHRPRSSTVCAKPTRVAASGRPRGLGPARGVRATDLTGPLGLARRRRLGRFPCARGFLRLPPYLPWARWVDGREAARLHPALIAGWPWTRQLRAPTRGRVNSESTCCCASVRGAGRRGWCATARGRCARQPSSEAPHGQAWSSAARTHGALWCIGGRGP